MAYYVCATFDAYDPVTGFFVAKMDCIEWNEDDLGPWAGPKYATKAECYAQSVCTQGENNPTQPTSNNYCGISISSLSIVDRTDTTLTFTINLPDKYNSTYIQYAFYDIDNNQLQDFKTICGTPDPLLTSDTFTITDNFTGVCAIAFRLLKPCEEESGSGGERSYVPIYDSGGPGAAGSHWEKKFRKPDYPTPDGFFYPRINDIMTHTWGQNFISNISASFLEDIGYNRTPGYIFDRCSWADLTSSLPFDIRDLLDEAASKWEEHVSYYPDVFDAIKNMEGGGMGSEGSDGSGSESGSGCTDEWNGLYLTIFQEFSGIGNDPNDNPIPVANAGVISSINLGGLKANAVRFSLGINASYATELSRNDWLWTMVHELGHALGIGTLWTMNPEFWLYKEDYPKTFEAYNDTIPSNFQAANICPDNPNDPVFGNVMPLESNNSLFCGCGCEHMGLHKTKIIGTFNKFT